MATSGKRGTVVLSQTKKLSASEKKKLIACLEKKNAVKLSVVRLGEAGLPGGKKAVKLVVDATD